MALSKLMFLDIYLSGEQDKDCLPYLFPTKYVVRLHEIQPSLQKVQFSIQVCEHFLHRLCTFNLSEIAVMHYHKLLLKHE